MALASTPYREAIASRLAGVRDFLLLFFFVGLGAGVDLGAIGAQVGPALVLSAFVLAGKPLVVMAIMGAMGYRSRTGFMAGTSLAQISEFSLILMAIGLEEGQVGPGAAGLVTLVALVTITASTYLIQHGPRVYAALEPALGLMERRRPFREDEPGPAAAAGAELILFGLGRYGREINRALEDRGVSVLGVDFDPEAVDRWNKRGWRAVYGDAGDPEFVRALPLAAARWVVIAINPVPDGIAHDDHRVELLRALRDAGFSGTVAVRSHDALDSRRLAAAGADLVLAPFTDAAVRAVEALGVGPGPRPMDGEAAARLELPGTDAPRGGRR